MVAMNPHTAKVCFVFGVHDNEVYGGSYADGELGVDGLDEASTAGYAPWGCWKRWKLEESLLLQGSIALVEWIFARINYLGVSCFGFFDELPTARYLLNGICVWLTLSSLIRWERGFQKIHVCCCFKAI